MKMSKGNWSMFTTNTGRARARTRALNRKLNAATAALGARLVGIEKAEAVIANLRDDAAHHSAEIAALTAKSAAQTEAINDFKQEVLQLHLQAAEMRGYIARVLEDDHVREIGGAKLAEPTLTPAERDHHISTLGRDDMARRAPPRPVRQGPDAMRPNLIVVSNAGCDDFRSLSHAQNWSSAPQVAAKKHWTQR
jgi:cell division protein FtsB